MRRVEVVVRFAGDLVDVVHVPAGYTVWIGTTPVIAKAGSEAAFGLVTVTMEATATEPPVPRGSIERRPYQFGAASLLAHLALVMTALWTVTSDPVSAPAIEANHRQPGGTRIKRFATSPQTTQRVPTPAPTEPPITADQTPEQEDQRDTPPPPTVHEFVPSEMTGGGLVEETAPKDGDGTSRFDPSTDPAFDSIKVGEYSTVATGRTAGEEYGAQARNSKLVVITCDRASCLVLGGEHAKRVRAAVQERLTELTDCYKQAAESGGGSVEIDFDVDASGAVKDLAVGEADPAGLCVAKILRSLEIEAAG